MHHKFSTHLTLRCTDFRSVSVLCSVGQLLSGALLFTGQLFFEKGHMSNVYEQKCTSNGFPWHNGISYEVPFTSG